MQSARDTEKQIWKEGTFNTVQLESKPKTISKFLNDVETHTKKLKKRTICGRHNPTDKKNILLRL